MIPGVLAGPTALLESVGPWILGAAAAGSTLLFLRVLFDIRGAGRDFARRLRPGRVEKGLFFVILALHWAAFGLLVWYHWRIWRDLPLALPAQAGDWINNNLRAMGRGALPLVDWSNPPRYALPLWIEGEKFFFWSLVYCTALLYPFLRRTEISFRAALYGFLNVYLWGVFIFAEPFTEPLGRFWSEVGPWFEAGVYVKAQLFFRIYPRMIFFYNAHYMWIHPPLLFAAYALLTVTFTACVFMLFSARREHERQAYGFAKIGYVLLTFGMLIGYPWALQAWGPNWWWDPKIASSIMMWLLYSAYLHTRLYTHRRSLWFTSAGLGMLCWFSLVFTYFMAWFFPGEHTF
jgi:hypothetical protein